MTYQLSPGVTGTFPFLPGILEETKRCAVEADRRIRVTGLHVLAQRHSLAHRYSGLACPETWSRIHGRYVAHHNGLIQLRYGDSCEELDIIRLFAHELRHIGQFHGGRQKYGYLTYAPLTEKQSEEDACAFEERILERLS